MICQTMGFSREISTNILIVDFLIIFSVQEAAIFFAKTAAERTPLGVRQSIENEGMLDLDS